MNGIGIDYQQAVTVMTLREGCLAKASTRIIDDGSRWLIPNAAAAEGLWGSKAFQAQPGLWSNSTEGLSAGPWLEEPLVNQFWEGLYQRTFRYLGRLAPIPREGYQVVVAISSTPDSKDAQRVLSIAEGAGFSQVQVIAATDALLFRWLAAIITPKSPPKILVVVSVTDCATCIASYRFSGQWSSDLLPTYARVSLARLDGIGFLHWCEHMQAEVERHLSELPSAKDKLLLRDGTLEFAARLGSVERTDMVEWTGPLHEICFSSPAFSPSELRKWPTVNRLAMRLPEAIIKSVMGIQSRPDLIVLGGVGAIWPFVADIAQEAGPVWQSSEPEQDIALGATWWPLLNQHCLKSDPVFAPIPSGLPYTDSAVVGTHSNENEQVQTEEKQMGQDIPPWVRDKF